MRLFGYYALHTFINTIKKLFKTWVAVFVLICFVLGIGIGLLAVSVSNTVGQEEETDIEMDEVLQEQLAMEEENPDPGFLEEHGITKNDMIELVFSAVILIMLLIYLLSSKSAAKIFKPGDVSILFSAPVKPQSVLLFRLVSSMGLQLVASIYMLAQLPNLIGNVGMSVWGAISMVLSWSVLMISGMLLQVILYTVGSRYRLFKMLATKVLIGLFAVLVAAYIFYARQQGDYLKCAIDMFTGEKTWWIPFWGWLRGFGMNAVMGNTAASLIYMGMILLGFAILIFLIWRMDADFYEDAIASVDRMTEMIENSKNSKTGVTVSRVRKKDRSEKLKRDGFNYGQGANVYFFKTIYNRFRFSTLKIFTKTTLLYTVLATLFSILFVDETEGNYYMTIVLILLVIVFYRTLGNPLQEDTTRYFFTMIPENMYAKLFFSMIGGTVCCLLDLILPMTLSGIILHQNPLNVIGWMLVIASMDFFGTSVGAFISISVPVNGGNTIKQMIQVLFMYFGIMPAGILIVIGLVTKQVALFTIIATIVNLGTGAIFFAITPRFLINGNQ